MGPKFAYLALSGSTSERFSQNELLKCWQYFDPERVRFRDPVWNVMIHDALHPAGVADGTSRYFDLIIQGAVQEAAEAVDFAFFVESTESPYLFQAGMFYPSVVYGKDDPIYQTHAYGDSAAAAITMAFLHAEVLNYLGCEYEKVPPPEEVEAILRGLLNLGTAQAPSSSSDSSAQE